MIKTIFLENTVIDEQYSKNYSIIDNHILAHLIECKNKINSDTNFKNWDRTKKFSNDYELIYISNKNNRKNSISNYKPLSRSYFKLWEMIHDFDLLKEQQKLNIFCLAEGPGGFMEAIIKFRNRADDSMFGITLKSVNKDIPGWVKAKKFIQQNNINITYGYDGTGNLYNHLNIRSLKTVCSNKFDFITGDGGFDFSNNFNKQEEQSYRIIFCEIISALYLLEKNGTFICKIFDIHSEITLKYIYILYSHFENVYITKPYTSRPANSEKYIVCKNFKGVEPSFLEMLFVYIEKWDSMKTNILSFIDIPTNFCHQVNLFNNLITMTQIKNIEYTITLINSFEKHTKTKIIEKQIENAKKWCDKYSVRQNKNSKFLVIN